MISGSIRSTTWRGIAVVIAVGMLLAMPLPAPWHTSWRAKLLDLGHIPLFAGLTWTLRRWTACGWMLAATVSIAIAGAGEIMQATIPFLGRSGDWDDFVRGAIGSLLMVNAATAGVKPHSAAQIIYSTLAAIVLLAWPVVDAGPIILDAWNAHRQFPVLADFTTPYEFMRFERKKGASDANRRDGTGRFYFRDFIVLRGDIYDRYPGVDFLPPCNDWRGYRNLVIEFDAIGAPQFSLVVKDFRKANGYTERFNRDDIKFEGGRQRLVVALKDVEKGPKAISLDLSQIQVVQIFGQYDVEKLHRGQVESIRLHRIALE